mgnify:FL=1|jgi:hypothetical protein
MKRSVVVRVLGVGFFMFMASVLSMVSPAVSGDHPDSPGVKIHTSSLEGFGFVYSLYHFPEKKTQHLMVAVTGPEGSDVLKGKVGFLVTGPGGSKQKAMAMGMKNAYGADMDFGKKGLYTIKMKAVFGEKKIFDRFGYEVK